MCAQLLHEKRGEEGGVVGAVDIGGVVDAVHAVDIVHAVHTLDIAIAGANTLALQFKLAVFYKVQVWTNTLALQFKLAVFYKSPSNPYPIPILYYNNTHTHTHPGIVHPRTPCGGKIGPR